MQGPRTSTTFTILTAIMLASTASAVTIPTSFVTEEKPFKKTAVGSDILTAGLYDNATCTGSPLASTAILAENVELSERIKQIKLKSASFKPPKAVRLHFSFSLGAAPTSEVYLGVTGPGIVGIPGDCQAQEPGASGATTDVSVRVFRSSNQTISNSTETAVLFNAEDYDTDDSHDNVTNSSRLVAPEDGRYLVYATVDWESSSIGVRRMQLRKNSSDTKGFHDMRGEATGSSSNSQHVSVVVNLVAGDYMELILSHTSGSDMDIFGIADELTYFGMVKMQ